MFFFCVECEDCLFGSEKAWYKDIVKRFKDLFLYISQHIYVW